MTNFTIDTTGDAWELKRDLGCEMGEVWPIGLVNPEMTQELSLIGDKAVSDPAYRKPTISCPMEDPLFSHVGESKVDQVFFDGSGTIQNLASINIITLGPFCYVNAHVL